MFKSIQNLFKKQKKITNVVEEDYTVQQQKYIMAIPQEKWEYLFSFISKLEKQDKFYDPNTSLFFGTYTNDADDFISLIIALFTRTATKWEPIRKILEEEEFEKLDILTICQTFCFFTRGERFADGFIGYYLENGVVVSLLKVLEKKVKTAFFDKT